VGHAAGPDMSRRRDEARLLTPEEAAERLRITVRQLHKKRRLGLIEGVKLGHRTIRYEEPAVEELRRRMRVNGSTRRQRALFSAEEDAMPARF
jgi:hypothetical protein